MENKDKELNILTSKYYSDIEKDFDQFYPKFDKMKIELKRGYKFCKLDKIKETISNMKFEADNLFKAEEARLKDFENDILAQSEKKNKLSGLAKQISEITGESEEDILKRIIEVPEKKTTNEKETKVKLDLDGCILYITTYNATTEETSEIMNDIKTKHTIFSSIKTKIELRYPIEDSNSSKYWNLMRDIALNTRFNHGLFVIVETNATNDFNTGEIVLTYIFHFRNL